MFKFAGPYPTAWTITKAIKLFIRWNPRVKSLWRGFNTKNPTHINSLNPKISLGSHFYSTLEGRADRLSASWPPRQGLSFSSGDRRSPVLDVFFAFEVGDSLAGCRTRFVLAVVTWLLKRRLQFLQTNILAVGSNCMFLFLGHLFRGLLCKGLSIALSGFL